MNQGKLEVLLIDARGIEDADFLSKADPYAVVTCRSQEHISSVASGAGSRPEWNETFIFTVSSPVPHLNIKIFDKDTFSADDFLGEAEIPLEPVFAAGSLPAASFNIVKDGNYCRKLKVRLTFTPEAYHDRELLGEEFGGWKQSSFG